MHTTIPCKASTSTLGYCTTRHTGPLFSAAALGGLGAWGFFAHWWIPEGLPLPAALVPWLLTLVGLLPLCARYGRFKESTAPESWWRIL